MIIVLIAIFLLTLLASLIAIILWVGAVYY